NPTWWRRRSALERGLTVLAIVIAFLCIGLAIGIGVLMTNSKSCDAETGCISMKNGRIEDHVITVTPKNFSLQDLKTRDLELQNAFFGNSIRPFFTEIQLVKKNAKIAKNFLTL
ncbi:hypothetical protein PV326_007570, partial [Microctonus aethiopoides]